MKYPTPSLMLINKTEAGAEIEGRATRKGMSNMKIGAYTKDWIVSDMSWRKIQPEGMSFDVLELNYKIKIETFIPLLLLGEIKRYDTIGSWRCSYQEILRHLQLASLFTESSLWKSVLEVIAAEKDNIYDILLGYYDMILKSGDNSDAQWEFYVKDHGDSSSPFSDVAHWGNLLKSTRSLNASKAITMKWEESYNNFMHRARVDVDVPRMIKAQFTYPGVRARPAHYTRLDSKSNDYRVVLLARKWRDRKVGGIPGLSQSTWRIYKNKSKDAIEEFLTKKMIKLSGLSELTRLSQEKIHGYLDLLERDWHLYDMKTAEKQTGLAFNWTGFTCDLGHPKFDPNFASEMYSGIGPTSPLNEIMMSVLLRVFKEDCGWMGKRAKYFSDNLAVDIELPEQVFLEPANEFCGLNIEKQTFGPPSLVTDNPKHRVKFNGKHQRQVQSIMYIMKPFLACLMNGVGGRDVTKRFLEWCRDKEIFVEGEGERKDYLVEEVLRQPQIHKDIRQDFAEVEDFVKQFWYVQMTDPEYSTNLRVSN